jgi:nucleoside-diphosphate-sugar epimerase
MHVFLAGASRGVGRAIAQQLRFQQVAVTAMLRSETSQSELEATGVQVAIADALNLSATQSAMATMMPVDAVISTVGGLPKDGQRADYLGNKNLIDAAVSASVKRFILVSSIGSGSSAIALPPQALQALSSALIDKDKAEQHLIASGLTYTIVRPGGLKSEPATGQGVLTEDYTIAGSIHRADVADLVCQCLYSERAHNKVLSAVDRTLVYEQRPFPEFALR